MQTLIPVKILFVLDGHCLDFPHSKSCDENSIGVRVELEFEASLERPGTIMGTQLSVS